MEKFDLGKFLADAGVAPDSGSREQITYIRRENLDSDPNNFYQLSGIKELADNIALCGLQQPIRVRENPDSPGRYTIVSGHRRSAALAELAKEDPERWTEVPCIIEQDPASPALQQLRLIYANANTRAMTSAELGEQAAQVEKLLYQLKEEGYDFPGRMRDHVAEAVNASRTKLARLKVIRENLAACWKPYYTDNTIAEDTAYALAHLPEEDQQIILDAQKAADRKIQYVYASDVKSYMERFSKIDKLKCKDCQSGKCDHACAKKQHAAKQSGYYYSYCSGCCAQCPDLASCKDACPLLDEKIKTLKAEKKEARRQEKAAEEAKDRPAIEYIQDVYERIGKARQACGATVQDLYKAQKVLYAESDDAKQAAMERGTAKISAMTTLPFGYTFRESDARKLIAVADLLHCSIDYLLGREEAVSNSDTPEEAEPVSHSDTWHTGNPDTPGDYIAMLNFGHAPKPYILNWDGDRWIYCAMDVQKSGGVVLNWIAKPEDPAEKLPLNDGCITSLSPSGHCGAAYYCENPYDCCLQCDDPCNSQCGWPDANVSDPDTGEG